MTATVSTLPVWKKDATAAEWLQELAAMALEHPERWGRVVVVFEEMHATEAYAIKQRSLSHGVLTNSDILAMCEEAKLRTYDTIRGRPE